METLNRRYSSQFDAQPFYAMFLREAEVLGEDKNPLVEEIVEKEIEKTIIDEKISSHDDKKEFTAKEPEKFEKDEKILLRRKREGKKEQGKLLGPYLVVERITDHLYRVKPIKGGDSEDVPVRRMVKYISDPVVSVEEEILINGKDETEYVVEKIIKHRFGGKLPIKFLVKWKDYGQEMNTWEYYPTVKDCEALEKYLEGNKALKGKLDKGQ
ncbi:hypothetical protein ADUPG1_005679 [Aduncisulcus paluster]|uniref:Chromo domain-containing protein n=1 Tax=Aduncisulcus paluster TaxID=2918883 RepID=A0ABQ5KHX1_9EUKA|nr:hypothetical protein ADUPG1_005212 [Aduncisulcus paluster]GKT30899.1 hypothetical protein ADUPG1_005679 [Aduncisulcus paluster]